MSRPWRICGTLLCLPTAPTYTPRWRTSSWPPMQLMRCCRYTNLPRHASQQRCCILCNRLPRCTRRLKWPCRRRRRLAHCWRRCLPSRAPRWLLQQMRRLSLCYWTGKEPGASTTWFTSHVLMLHSTLAQSCCLSSPLSGACSGGQLCGKLGQRRRVRRPRSATLPWSMSGSPVPRSQWAWCCKAKLLTGRFIPPWRSTSVDS